MAKRHWYSPILDGVKGVALWPVVKIIEFLVWHSERKDFRVAINNILSIGLPGLLVLIGVSDKTPPTWWPHFQLLLPYSYAFVTVKGLFQGLLIYIVLDGFVPLLAYIPHATSMRLIGLAEAKADMAQDEDLLERCVRKYLKFHASGQPVRVICISGKSLFMERGPNWESPLHSLAVAGKLQVLFPKNSPENRTIVARYDTYTKDFRQENYQTIEALVREIESSKNFLKVYPTNQVFEHDALCMWRVILLSEHCIVQAYFPNCGYHSDGSPVVVFQKDTSEFSYYYTFESMFKLLAQEQVKKP